MLYQILGGIALVVLGVIAGYFSRKIILGRRSSDLESKLKEDSAKARNEAQGVILEAKSKAVSLLEEVKREEKERKAGIDRLEERLLKQEQDIVKKEEEFRAEKMRVSNDLKRIDEAEVKIDEAKKNITSELAKLAGMSPEQAKTKLFKDIEDQNKEELAQTLHKIFKERKEEIEKKSMEIMTTAVQRYARSHVADITTSVFNLPSEDLKGKIIGREGRNIRTLERLAGVELIVDETPDAIIISSFDPLRREIAKMAIEKLIKDGRIQPAKIEEKVEEAKSEMDKRMHEIGEAAAYELGILDFPKEILQLLGRLNFRTSFGQNVLTHSIEMAYLASMMATELGANIEVSKKGALLHDIGKAIDHEVQGTHVELGRKILKKYGISDDVIAAMQSHHEEYPFSTPESFIVTAADALSAARPGARRGTLENYIKRLEDLEKIANSFPGVKNSYAIAAGRELRVFVVPEKIDDFKSLQLAKDIATKIESELRYPGEIKVNVIREIRAVEYAK